MRTVVDATSSVDEAAAPPNRSRSANGQSTKTRKKQEGKETEEGKNTGRITLLLL